MNIQKPILSGAAVCFTLLLPSLAFGNHATNVICNQCIDNTDIARDAVGTNKIVDKGVTNAKIDSGAVGTGKIADFAVTTDKIANQAVTNFNIKKGAVGTGKIADDAITSEKLADGAVTALDIAGSSVEDYHLAPSARPRFAFASRVFESHYNLANGCSEYTRITFNAPSEGIVVIEAHGQAFFRGTPSSGTELVFFLELNQSSSSAACSFASARDEGGTNLFHPPANQSTSYDLYQPVHMSRAFAVQPGSTTYYLNGERTAVDTTVAGMLYANMRATFYPGASIQ